MNIKILGQVFTPKHIVNLLLDKSNYEGPKILHKYVIEPSCGDGAILIEVVKRYIKFAKEEGWSSNEIKEGLEKHIYGIELDKEIYEKCIVNLNEIVENENIQEVDWNIHNENTLFKNYTFKFDYIIGNPPYIRIQNIQEIERDYIRTRYSTCRKGNIDIYLAFYEWGIKHMKRDGVLVYITPNTFMHNSSSLNFRDFILDSKILKGIINFESYPIFDVSTYNAIMILKPESNIEEVEYVTYDKERNSIIRTIDASLFKNKTWNFMNAEEEELIEKNKIKQTEVKQHYIVQYALTTMRDKIYISKNHSLVDENYYLFNGHIIEKEMIRPVVKASTYKGGEIIEKIIFPYERVDGQYQIINEQKMKDNFPMTYHYFLNNKEELMKRNLEPNFKEWYEYGRRQAIQQMDKEKLIFKHMVKTGEGGVTRFYKIPNDVFVYSGIFITGYDLEQLKTHLEKEEFLQYCSIFGKNKSGGYKEISPKIIKEFRY